MKIIIIINYFYFAIASLLTQADHEWLNEIITIISTTFDCYTPMKQSCCMSCCFDFYYTCDDF